jgi:hypothetical protein
VNETIGYRANPWLVVSIVAVIALLATALVLVASQSGLIHMIGGMLQGPQRMAPVCGGLPLPC